MPQTVEIIARCDERSEAGQDPWRTPGDRSKQKGGVWDVVIHTGEWPLRFMECKRNGGRDVLKDNQRAFLEACLLRRDTIAADFAIVNWVQV